MIQRTGLRPFSEFPVRFLQCSFCFGFWGCLGAGAVGTEFGQEPQPLLPLGFSSCSHITPQLKTTPAMPGPPEK